VITWRLAATAESAEVEPSLVSAAPAGEVRHVRTRPVVFDRGSTPEDTPVYRREALAPGMRFSGPAVVEERETTSVIRPGWAVEVADDGSLIATRGSR